MLDTVIIILLSIAILLVLFHLIRRSRQEEFRKGKGILNGETDEVKETAEGSTATNDTIPVLLHRADQRDIDWPEQPPLSPPSDLNESMPLEILDIHGNGKATTSKPVGASVQNEVAASKPATRQQRSGKSATSNRNNNTQPIKYLAMNLQSIPGQFYGGKELFDYLRSQNFRFGKGSIFHYHLEGSVDTLFSMANGTEPGTFDYYNLQSFITDILCFYRILEEGKDNTIAFNTMLTVIEAMQKHFGGSIKDEEQSHINPQVIQHYYNRIQDFERQSLITKH